MTRKWWTLTAVCMGIFMLLLDITVVNVALPSIARSLGASFGDLQWVVDAYALTLAALLLTAGSLADRVGRRTVFTTGLGIFTLSSLAFALAPDALFLILARAVQGIGGAAMFATSLSLLAQEFQGRDRGTAFGIYGATTGASVALGPVLGGVLTTGLGWHAIFLLNIPIGLATIGLTLTRVAETRNPGGGRLDWPGFATFSGALAAFVFALIRGNALGWSSPLIVACLSGAAFLLMLFIVLERRRAEPMLDLRLFATPTVSGASVAAFAISASIFALLLYITIYLQSVLGLSALGAGLRLLPLTLLSFVCAGAAGKASEHMPARLMLAAGLGLIGAGLLAMRGIDATSTWSALLAGFCLCGLGVGLVNPPLSSIVIGVVTPAQSGMASGMNNTFRQVGIATGIAGLGAVFQHQVHQVIQTTLGTGAHATQLAQAISAGASAQAIAHAPAGVRPLLIHAQHAAFASALNEVFLIGALVALAGALASLLLVRSRDLIATATSPTQTSATSHVLASTA